MSMKCWIARDKNNSLWLFEEKPFLDCEVWRFNPFCNIVFYEVDEDFLPEITFENSPQQVELKLVKI